MAVITYITKLLKERYREKLDEDIELKTMFEVLFHHINVIFSCLESVVMGLGRWGFRPRLSVILFFLRNISKTIALKYSTVSPGKLYILGSKCQRSSLRGTKTCRRGFLHSCECWLASSSCLYEYQSTCI